MFPGDTGLDQSNRISDQLAIFKKQEIDEKDRIANGKPVPNADIQPPSKAVLTKIQGEANTLRIQVGKEVASTTFHSIAKLLCSHDPSDVPTNLGVQRLNYEAACAAFPNKQAAHDWTDPTRGTMGVCGLRAAEILTRCEEYDQIEADLTAAVRLNQPAMPAPPPAQPPLIPSPGEGLREVERQTDKSTLTNDYQGMATIADALCENPDDLDDQSAKYCAYARESTQLVSKYRQRQEDPPASWSDASYSRCAGDLLRFMGDPFTNLCGGSTDMRNAVLTRARALNQQYHPAPNNPQPNNPRPRPNPTPRDPNWQCPPRCTCSGTRILGCQPDPLP